MAEALISPGVFLTENDQSQITAGPITVGAALVGPAVYGKVNIPTLVLHIQTLKLNLELPSFLEVHLMSI